MAPTGIYVLAGVLDGKYDVQGGLATLFHVEGDPVAIGVGAHYADRDLETGSVVSLDGHLAEEVDEA